MRTTFGQLRIGTVFRYPGGMTYFIKTHATSAKLARQLRDDVEFTESDCRVVMQMPCQCGCNDMLSKWEHQT